MTQEEIIEYNKRCAEFLGNKLISKNDFNMLGEHAYTGEHEHTNWAVIEYLNYHHDWNGIMEVIEAIEKLKYVVITKTSPTISETWIQCIITIQNCTVDSLFNNKFIVEYKSDYSNNQTKKEAVVQAINQFLIWYNENSRNQKL